MIVEKLLSMFVSSLGAFVVFLVVDIKLAALIFVYFASYFFVEFLLLYDALLCFLLLKQLHVLLHHA